MSLTSKFPSPFPPSAKIHPSFPRVASVEELSTERYRSFMREVNAFSAKYSLREFVHWSKEWEYPWLFDRGLGQIDWQGKHLLDFGSEISPMPWMLAMQGAVVTLIEADPQWIPRWEKLREELGVQISWEIVTAETLPIPSETIDVVTSFSVIEHQPDKLKAADEIARVLRPNGSLFISFDICEPSMGMSFPEWNGSALTMAEFENELWRHPAFGNSSAPIPWNLRDIPSFKAWHLESATHHNYVTAAAVLVKKS